MSSTIYWEPVARKRHPLPLAIKQALHKRHGSVIAMTMDANDMAYLHGLLDADCEGAQELIDAIDKYGEISLKEEF